MAATLLRADCRERSWTSALGCGLYHELSAEAGNLFFSPYSVLGALMVARAGAAGTTLAEIDVLLDRPQASQPLTESFGRLLRRIGRTARPDSGLVELVTANALWCQGGWPVRHEYVDTLRARLGAEVGAADFEGSPALAARTINAWAAETTRGRVPAILGKAQIPRATRMLLSNVVYFRAPWLEPFEAAHTRPEPFHLPDGRQVDVAMMHRTGRYDYGRIRHGQVLQLPYVLWPVRMFVLLPDAGRLRDVESELRPGLVGRLIRDARPRETRLSLPVCRLQSSLRLRGALEKLGLARAFAPGADFTGISEQPGLFLQDIFHRPFLEVDETGAEAPAATPLAPAGHPLGPRGNPLEFRVDRPYLVFIGDTASQTVFFVGRITDPRG
jgi:serpin B